ncbi:ATP-binding protein [Plantactinospora sp. CA-290183]|uniref:ATP-binding protein n=1 Tax=Plantactinospora sp. CA-290183 TaxID=3240006 RepID=UPI003D921660
MTDGPLRDQRTETQHGLVLLQTAFDSERMSAVRQMLTRCLTAAGLPDQRLDDFVTAINEAMSNAVRHGGGDGELRLWRERDLVCEVWDSGPGLSETLPIPRSRPEPSAQGGMGLWLARELTDSIDVVSDGDGVRVRMVMAFRPGPDGAG